MWKVLLVLLLFLPGLSFLLPFLTVGYVWQLYNAHTLYQMSQWWVPLFSSWQIKPQTKWYMINKLHSLLICHDLWFYINALGAQIKLQIFCWWSRWKVLFKTFLVWDWEVNTDVDSRKLSLWFVTELPLTQTFPDC